MLKELLKQFSDRDMGRWEHEETGIRETGNYLSQRKKIHLLFRDVHLIAEP
jgi:hypothetical protein